MVRQKKNDTQTMTSNTAPYRVGCTRPREANSGGPVLDLRLLLRTAGIVAIATAAACVGLLPAAAAGVAAVARDAAAERRQRQRRQRQDPSAARTHRRRQLQYREQQQPLPIYYTNEYAGGGGGGGGYDKYAGIRGSMPAYYSSGGVLGAQCLYQSDFDSGTYIIDTPGQYQLCEDIVFHPNPPKSGQNPSEAFQPDYNVYDPKHYGLGFFAAISIVTEDVELYLNGHVLEQSAGHALIQRFYAHIELGSSPFLQGVGPADFGVFKTASRVKILGPGILGRASHHGVHGNDNSYIEIRDVTFVDFEVAAVSLNNVDQLLIENSIIPRNRRDVPIVGIFSSAHFITPYGKWLRDNYPDRNITLEGVNYTSVELYDNLMDAINDVYDTVVRKKGDGRINELFNNPYKVVDGPCYAFLVHGKGPAVNDFGEELSPDDSTTSSNVVIRNNDIRNIKCWTKEVPAAVIDDAVQVDVRGAVFQLQDTFTGKYVSMYDDGRYKRNPVADMQIFVAQAIHDGTFPTDDPVLQTQVNTISEKLVQWATSGEAYHPYYRCNGDSMHHVGKGIAIIRVEDTKGFQIANNTIQNIENLSLMPHAGCDDYHKDASSENPGEQQMGNVRGISVASFRQPTEQWYLPPWYPPVKYNVIEWNTITGADSLFPYFIIGIDVQGDSSGLNIRNNYIDVVPGTGPHRNPKHIGIRIREMVDRRSIIIQSNTVDEGILFPSGEEEKYEMQMQSGGCPFTQGLVFAPMKNPHTGEDSAQRTRRHALRRS